jgi:hypothetical protein
MYIHLGASPCGGRQLGLLTGAAPVTQKTGESATSAGWLVVCARARARVASERAAGCSWLARRLSHERRESLQPAPAGWMRARV